MKDLMIDIETLSLKPNAAIISMGYLMFNPEKGKNFTHETLVVIDQGEDFNGRDVNWDTIKFHLSLVEETHQYLLGDESTSLERALDDLSDYIKKHKPKNIWANGICFDIGILEDAYNQLGITIPWKFNKVRDARTLYKFCEVDWEAAKRKTKGNAHNPLYDARVQAHLVKQCFEEI